MCSRYKAGLLACLLPIAAFAAPRVLRVCADPNNLPYSNQQEQGFENRLAALIARDLGAHLEYTWFSERKSFLKNSLDAGKCDAVMGVRASEDEEIEGLDLSMHGEEGYNLDA